MTVSSSTNKVIGSGNGVTTSWPFAFQTFDETHLAVTYTDANGDETTVDADDYTVALNADQDASPGGTVTYSPAIASGTKLTILRAVPYTQATDIKNQGGYFPEVLERALDLLEMQVQQVKEQLARSIKLSPSQAAIGELQSTDAARAGMLLGFDGAGALAVLSGGADAAVSSVMQAVVGSATLALARTAMGLGALAELGTPPAGNVANASLADMATARLKGRSTAGAGPPEDLTLTQALDLIGSATKGDILVRDTSAWARLPAGAVNTVLQGMGAGELPAYKARTIVAACSFNSVTPAFVGTPFNFTTTTDNGTGNYTMNFGAAMPDAEYLIAMSWKTSSGNSETVATWSNKTVNGFGLNIVAQNSGDTTIAVADTTVDIIVYGPPS